MSTIKTTPSSSAAAWTSVIGDTVAQKGTEHFTRGVDDPLEIDHPLEVDDFVEPTSRVPGHRSFDLPRGGSRAPTHTALRTLARIVPLGYGAFFGTMASNTGIGLAAGILISIMIDLSMDRHSILRAACRGLVTKACPVVAGVARVLGRAVAGMGAALPPEWSQMRCRATR